jgi:parvulin-like peptidyl-prolyl isomerase
VRPLAVLFAWLAFASASAAQQPVASHPTAASTHSPVREVGRVNGVPLSSDRLDAALNALIPMESFHRNVGADSVAALRQRALKTVIDEELQYQGGVRLGLTASDAEVDEGLARARRGSKSPEAFDQALRQSRVPMADVRREIRRALTITKAYDHEVTSRCQVGAAEAERFYADSRERFVVPEQLHVYAITIGVDPSGSSRQWADASARANDVLRQLRSGASFDELARTYSTDPSRDKGGDMGLFHRGTLNDEFEKVARGMKPGDVSDVVQTLYGYHIIRVAEIRPPEQRSYADMGEEIKKDLTSKRCADTAGAWTARLRAGATIELADAAGSPRPSPAPPRAGKAP